MSLRLGVDLDGICAEFNIAYKNLIELNTPIRLPEISDYYPNTWNYEKAAGLSPKDSSMIWSIIKSSDNFWESLPTYPETQKFLEWLSWLDGDIYFVTNRPGRTAKKQTEYWLQSQGFVGATVLISEHKGLCCQALNLTHYIDDKVENCEDVKDKVPNTKGYMLKRPWNYHMHGIPRLNSVFDFMKLVEEDL